MKKIILFVSLFISPLIASAASIDSISPEYVVPGETVVTINGTGFGDSSSGKSIYFDYLTAYSISWSDTRITVKTPYDVYRSGIIKISGSFITGQHCSYGYCYDETDYLTLTSQTYFLKPEIEESTETVYNNGYFEAVGNNFGMTPGSISVGDMICEVIEWKDYYFKCNVGELKSSINTVSYSIKIPDSNNYELSGRLEYLPKISNDTYSFYQTYLKQIKITDVWSRYTGAGIKIAVIDSGVDINNPDLKNSLWVNQHEVLNNDIDDDGNGYVDDYYGYNFVDDNDFMSPKNNHGTQVAGIIAASRDNNLGIAGIAPNAKIMSLIACDMYGCNGDDIKSAIKYAVNNGANIINLSLGGSGSLGYDPSYDEIIKYAYDRNVLVIAAAGNGDTEGNGTRGQDMDIIKSSPICNEDSTNMILGVGAFSEDKTPTYWTNYSQNYIDVSAPGTDILSTAVPIYTEDDAWYTFADGTSFSAPIVAGVAALLKEKNPAWKNFELINQIISRSDDFANGWNVYGKIINAYNIINSSNPTAVLRSNSPSVIDENNFTLHLYGENFYNNVKIRIFNNQFDGYVPANIITVESGKIDIDLGSWSYILPFKGVFSISIDADDERGTRNNTINNAFEIVNLMRNNVEINNDLDKTNSVINVTQPTKHNDLNTQEFIDKEKRLIVSDDTDLSEKLTGRILLQVEENGEGWYVNPSDNKRYFLGRPNDAFNIMRELGLGISNKDFDSFGNYAPARLSGKILIKVEDSGKAYYVNPVDLKIYYLGRPEDAFDVMRNLGLGITNNDIRKIDIN